jgi:hypothetical protein
MMLLLCHRHVDWLARDKTKFTISQRWTDGASNGGKHGHKI